MWKQYPLGGANHGPVKLWYGVTGSGENVTAPSIVYVLGNVSNTLSILDLESGAVTDYPLPSPSQSATGLDCDGIRCFVPEPAANKVAVFNILTNHFDYEVPIPTPNASPRQVAVAIGNSGNEVYENVYVLEDGAQKLAVLKLPGGIYTTDASLKRRLWSARRDAFMRLRPSPSTTMRP